MHEELKGRGFNVLAFPCNQFGKQEPGTNEEIYAFATSKYSVTFPMFAKSEVNGDGASDLYKFLRSAQKEADGGEDIPWNFTKFLVDKSGNVVARIGPQTAPEDIRSQIEGLL